MGSPMTRWPLGIRWRRVCSLAAVVAASGLYALPVIAQTAPPDADQDGIGGLQLDDAQRRRRAELLRQRMLEVVDLINGNFSGLREGQFSPAALEAMGIDDIQMKFGKIRKQSGGFTLLGLNALDDTSMHAWLRANGGQFVDQDFDLVVRIELVEPHRIEDINFAPAEKIDVSGFKAWSDVDKALDKLDFVAAMSAWELTADGTLAPIHRYHADQRMSIGTAATLWIIKALVDRVGAGDLTWDRSLSIHGGLKSLPQSPISRLPQGFSLPLWEMAKGMMFEGDTTGFDHLVAVVGREELTRRLASSLGNAGTDLKQLDPFLSSYELFQIKCSLTNAPMNEYAAATPAERWELLKTQVPDLEVVNEFFFNWNHPQKLMEVGWFSSADGLAKVMADLWRARKQPDMQRLDEIMEIPPRVPIDRRAWRRAWLEMGAEPGAVSGTMALQRADDGRVFILAMVFNDDKKDVSDSLGLDVVFGARKILQEYK